MRTKVTFILLFLNAALFLFIFRFERNWRTERAALEVRRRVLGSEAADIRTLEVSAAGRVRFRLERRGETWFLTRPIEWPANPVAVNRLLTDLQLLEHVTSFTVRDVEKNGLSLSYYGLEHPRLTVSFTSGGRDTTGGAPVETTLKIGDETRGGQSLYLLSPDGTRIHVVGRELADDLSAPIAQLRSDTILTIPIFEARSFTLQTAGVRVRLRRDGDGGRWIFETPIPARANKNATELAINDLDALRVKSFVAPDPAALPSADPALRATIEGNNRTETLLVGRPAPAQARTAGATDYYAQFEEGESVRPAVFVVAIPNPLMNTLRRAREDLRERRILDFDPGAVTTITLAAPNRPELVLQRLEAPAGGAEAGWQILLTAGAKGPQTLRADRAEVGQLLQKLALLSAARFQSDAPQAADLENWGFNRPEREITLAFAPAAAGGGSGPIAPVVLQIGLPAEPERFAYAKLATAQSVYAVDRGILSATPVSPLDWRERLLRTLPAGAITGVTLTDLARGAAILEWRRAPGKTPPAALRGLLEALSTLRAGRFTLDHFGDRAEDPSGEDRPWRYRLDAAISLPAGAGGEERSTSTLWLTERLAGDLQIAGSREFNAEFAIDQQLLDALWTQTYGSRDPGPPAPPAANPAQ